jgi:hypothetical protein
MRNLTMLILLGLTLGALTKFAATRTYADHVVACADSGDDSGDDSSDDGDSD